MNETLNKKALADKLAEKLDITKKEAGLFIDSFIEEVVDALKDGAKVDLSGFGKFEVKERAAREGINPQTKEKILVKASKKASFKPAKALKDAVN